MEDAQADEDALADEEEESPRLIGLQPEGLGLRHAAGMSVRCGG